MWWCAQGRRFSCAGSRACSLLGVMARSLRFGRGGAGQGVAARRWVQLGRRSKSAGAAQGSPACQNGVVYCDVLVTATMLHQLFLAVTVGIRYSLGSETDFILINHNLARNSPGNSPVQPVHGTTCVCLSYSW